MTYLYNTNNAFCQVETQVKAMLGVNKQVKFDGPELIAK